jgi:hypothetical protein
VSSGSIAEAIEIRKLSRKRASERILIYATYPAELASKSIGRCPALCFVAGFGGFAAPEPHQGDFDVALLPQNMSLHFKNVCAILSVRGYEHIRKAHDAWKEITSMYRKEIIYDRETRDYAMYLDGELVGFARTYHEAEVTLDQLVFELMTGQYFREAA